MIEFNEVFERCDDVTEEWDRVRKGWSTLRCTERERLLEYFQQTFNFFKSVPFTGIIDIIGQE